MLVGKVGVEPTRPLGHQILRLARLPIPPYSQEKAMLKHTKELLEPIVSSSISFAEVLRKLGIKPTGGNYVNLQRNIDKFGISTDHMLNQASNAGREFVPFEELTKNEAIKKRLIRQRGHRCEECTNTEWRGRPISTLS